MRLPLASILTCCITCLVLLGCQSDETTQTTGPSADTTPEELLGAWRWTFEDTYTETMRLNDDGSLELVLEYHIPETCYYERIEEGWGANESDFWTWTGDTLDWGVQNDSLWLSDGFSEWAYEGLAQMADTSTCHVLSEDPAEAFILGLVTDANGEAVPGAGITFDFMLEELASVASHDGLQLSVGKELR